MLAEYLQEERRGSALERTQNKGAKRPNEQWGLYLFMADQPRTYSPFLYNSSLAAHI